MNIKDEFSLKIDDSKVQTQLRMTLLEVVDYLIDHSSGLAIKQAAEPDSEQAGWLAMLGNVHSRPRDSSSSAATKCSTTSDIPMGS